ncbi:MAG: DUF5804 family protein [Methanomicrobiales archaeon]|nr:DUF5804 family protein [Methanomicrobiales archaeon]
MEILLVPLEGVPLYATLFASETSRSILQFYRPDDLGFAVRVRTTSLGAALSLVSELRWYVRRYTREVLFRLEEGVYASHALAEEIYARESEPDAIGGGRHLFVFRSGSPLKVIPAEGGGKEVDTADMEGAELVIDVRGPLRGEKAGEKEEGEGGDEAQNSDEMARSL